MPYARRSYRSRRRYRGRYRARRSSKTSDVSLNLSKLWRNFKYLKSMINVEKKLHSLTASINPSSTGTITHVTQIAQGDGQGNREGNSIKTTYFGFRGRCSLNASASNTFLRVMLIRDTQQQSDTTPAISDVLENVSVSSFLNPETLGRYTVLFDQTYSLESAGSTGSRTIEFNKKLNSHVRFNGSAAGDIQKGGLFLIFLSDHPTNTPGLAYEARLRYVDN